MPSKDITNSSSYFDIEVFKSAANGYKSNAVLCLVLSSVTTFALFYGLLFFYSEIPKDEYPDTYKDYFLLLFPIVTLSLILVAVIRFCAKLYFINRRVGTTYEQHYNVLKLYKKPYEAANKKDKKEIMRQALMATIFFEQQTAQSEKSQNKKNEFNINLMESAQKYFMKNLK